MDLAQEHHEPPDAVPAATDTKSHFDITTVVQRESPKSKDYFGFCAIEPDGLEKNSLERREELDGAHEADDRNASPSFALVPQDSVLTEPTTATQRLADEESIQSPSFLPPLVLPQYSLSMLSQVSLESKEVYTGISPKASPPNSLNRYSEGAIKEPIESVTQAPSSELSKREASENSSQNVQERFHEDFNESSLKGTNRSLPRPIPIQAESASRKESRGSCTSKRMPARKAQLPTNSTFASRILPSAPAPLPIPQVEPRLYNVKQGLGMAAAIDQPPASLDLWCQQLRNAEEWPSFYDHTYQVPLRSLYDEPNTPHIANQAQAEAIARSRRKQLVEIKRNARSDYSDTLFRDANPQYSAEYESSHPGFEYSNPSKFASKPVSSSLGYQSAPGEAYNMFPQDYQGSLGYGSNTQSYPASFMPHHLHSNCSQREFLGTSPENTAIFARNDGDLRSEFHSASPFQNQDASNLSSAVYQEKHQSPGSLGHANSTSGNLPGSRQTDSFGVPWLVFEYPENRTRKLYRIQCDIEGIDVSELSEDFKQHNCGYPKALVPPEKYRGHRQDYEMECNEIGWKLVLRNSQLAGHRGLTQRAVDTYRNTTDASTRSRRARRMAKQNRANNGPLGFSNQRARSKEKK